MSIFGFGTPSELTTPIGAMVKSATDPLRISADWTVNLQICDEINRNRREYSDQAVRAIRRRLNDSDHQTVFLALILLETCMKNCGLDFASTIDRATMDDIVRVSQGNRGAKNAEEALRLIVTWARVFERRRGTHPLFFDTYMALRSRGVSFPKEDEAAIRSYEAYVGAQQPSSRSSSRDVAPSEPAQARAPPPLQDLNSSGEDEFIKLQLDLSVVMEKVKLCREILQVSPGIQHDEALADVVGFLEACRDRLVDVIEAGTQGLLGEELFAVALKVNDAVLRTLEAERTGKPIPVNDEDEANPAASKSSEANLLELTPTPSATQQPPSAAAFTEDLFRDFGKPAATAAATAPPPAATNQPQGGAAMPAAAAAADFDPFGLTQPSRNPFDDTPAPAAPASAVQPPAAPRDDFDIFLSNAAPAQSSAATAPAPVPAPAATPAKSTGSAAQDFDDFLASLERKS